MKTRITEMLKIEIPIVQAPMGYIARAQLASAVSNAGGLGIVETSSGRFDEIKLEFEKMRDLTDKPWGVNVAQLFVRDPGVVDFVVDNGVRFVTTSAGDPAKMVPLFKQAGLTVFHVVPTLRGALKAIEAGVDGLVVEGIEGGGFKNPDGASTMVLIPMIAAKVGVPIIAAGGICDGISMAGAFALGAEGVQMGTRMVSSAESPIHDNWKQLVIDSSETDTIVVNRYHKPAMRVLRTGRSLAAERDHEASKMVPDSIFKLYFGGDMEVFFAFGGQVAGRIDRVQPVREILTTAWAECQQRLRDMGRWAAED
jgi:enoyl-[acyl-carrier protein] reductase II